MPLRKITQRNKDGKITALKKYSGIFEFYSTSDHDKKTLYHYIQYPQVDAKLPHIKKAVHTLDRDEALEILIQKRNEVKRERQKIKDGLLSLEDEKLRGTLTLDELAKFYFEKRPDITAKRRYYNHVSSTIIDNSKIPLGNYKIKSITIANIENLQKVLFEKINPRTKRNYAPRTINEVIFVLRAIINLGIKNKWCSDNPVKDDEIKKKPNIHEPGRVLTDNELDSLWNNDKLRSNTRLFLFATLCYYTGARPDAVIDIQVKHINFNDNKIALKAMKKGKNYSQKVKNEVIEMLRSWIKQHNLAHNHFIFFPKQSYDRAKTEGTREKAKNKSANYSGYRRALQKIYDPMFNVGIDSYDIMYKITTYSLRRTSATKIYKTHGIIAAKNFLNHTDIKTTMKYLNISEKDDDLAVEVL